MIAEQWVVAACNEDYDCYGPYADKVEAKRVAEAIGGEVWRLSPPSEAEGGE